MGWHIAGLRASMPLATSPISHKLSDLFFLLCEPTPNSSKLMDGGTARVLGGGQV